MLASSTLSKMYAIKILRLETECLLSSFQLERRILGDDPCLRRGRGKLALDIYLLALEVVNSAVESGRKLIKASECLVFEDSVAGVEAGRWAGMRVVWVLNPGVADKYEVR